MESSTLEKIDETYKRVTEALSNKDDYDAICLNKFAPIDRYEQRQWISKIQSPFRTMIYRYPYGNHFSVVSYLWKVPDHGHVDETKSARLVSISSMILTTNLQHKKCESNFLLSTIRGLKSANVS